MSLQERAEQNYSKILLRLEMTRLKRTASVVSKEQSVSALI